MVMNTVLIIIFILGLGILLGSSQDPHPPGQIVYIEAVYPRRGTGCSPLVVAFLILALLFAFMLYPVP
jgi:hypothetical protein